MILGDLFNDQYLAWIFVHGGNKHVARTIAIGSGDDAHFFKLVDDGGGFAVTYLEATLEK